MNWEAYWTSYPKRFAETDYLRQVKNTVGGQPVPDALIRESIAMICSSLELKQNDTLLDLCCGNGLVTKELAKKCHSVVGVDFSPPLIAIANSAHHASNISYLGMNVLDFISSDPSIPNQFTKILMVGSLQYFKNKEGFQLMRVISDHLSDSGVALLTGIPDRKQRAAFYNTVQRRQRWIWERTIGRDQMGRWWDKAEIERVCEIYRLNCRFTNASPIGLHYRFDVRITR